MSVTHIGLVLDNLDVKPAVKLVAVVLADHADREGLCWPSYRKISERTGMDDRTVRRHVKALIDMGVVSKVRTGAIVNLNGKAVRVSNLYRVNASNLIRRGSKLSTRDLLMGGSTDHLEMDKSDTLGGVQLSTKSSNNHQSNRQRSEPVDNSTDREPNRIGSLVNAYIQDALNELDGDD